jgi:hypothetical protein
MKALLLAFSLFGAVLGTTLVAQADDHYYRRSHSYYEDRHDHDWNDGYWRHHRYGYWHGRHGYWGHRHGHYVFIPVGPGVGIEVH